MTDEYMRVRQGRAEMPRVELPVRTYGNPTNEVVVPAEPEVIVEQWRCKRCGDERWLGWRAGPAHEGFQRYAQCVPCGHVQDLPKVEPILIHEPAACGCASYRAAEMGAPIPHSLGEMNASGDCKYATYDAIIAARGRTARHSMPASHAHPQLPQRQAAHMEHMQAVRRQVNIHSDPSIVNRLVRLVEELLERDDVRMDADTNWYDKQLRIIKAEINGHESGGEEEAQGAAPAGTPST
jgi:hypothetical protein